MKIYDPDDRTFFGIPPEIFGFLLVWLLIAVILVVVGLITFLMGNESTFW